MNNRTTTQQINSYLREQQIIRSFNSLLLAIKKADRTRQDVSAFTIKQSA